MKTCPSCKMEKPVTMFGVHRRTKDGRCCYCKDCASKIGAANYQKDKEKVKARHKEWQKNNPEKMAEYNLKWRQNNPEQVKQMHRNYHVRNKESIAVYDKTRRENNIEKFLEKERLDYVKHKSNRQVRMKKWRDSNPHMITAYAAGRRAAKRQRTMNWLTESQMKDMEFMYVLSDLLTKTTGIQHHVDHIVPLRSKYVSGLHVPWNLQVLPAIDNLKKNNHFTPGRQNATAT